jgi:hypothetical protein
MALGVAREGSEPSLFYDVVVAADTLSVAGWFIHKDLGELFELELWVREEGRPRHRETFIVRLDPAERKKTSWKTKLKLEVKRSGIRPDQD